MTIAYTDDDVKQYMAIILAQGIENPVLVDKYMMGTELEVDCISDGEDVLIPGIMEHIERAGVHSGDSIAVYPPYNLNDMMLEKICDVSQKLALELGTQGLVNIQYLIYHNELYVIEVNPRASRTIPYISKVTGVPMVELATKIMVGQKLKDLGFGTGLYKTPPYVAVKVPVFSFEKLNDVNSKLGPEMKSTGEVLGVGKNLVEALFKGLVSAGFKTDFHSKDEHGVLITVTKQDRFEIVGLAKSLTTSVQRFGLLLKRLRRLKAWALRSMLLTSSERTTPLWTLLNRVSLITLFIQAKATKINCRLHQTSQQSKSAWHCYNHFTRYCQCRCGYHCITLQGNEHRAC